MRPVNKGDWPKDPNTNALKVFKSEKKDNTYKDAKTDLICRLGPYCSYCETKLRRRDLHVEHMLPKSLHPSLRGDWGNFLLACGPCNEPKSNKDIKLDDVYWPDRDNTASIFDYQFHKIENGQEIAIIKVNSNLSQFQQQKAQRTLELTALNRYPNGPDEPTPGDQRYEDRKEAWNHANLSREMLKQNDNATMRDYIVVQAQGKGFFSVWMTVFQDDPDMLERFIKAFPGTVRECFDEHGRPKPTISRPKSSTNVEPQPSYDSHISDDEAESLLEEEEETSTEPEAETPQPDSEFLPVDDYFRSEENSRSLFTQFIDAVSGNRQDYIGDRDELLSLEDSEPESEDSLSEESAESESPDEPEAETEAIDSEPEPEDFLSEESAESESPDEPEAETEAIDSETESEDFLSEESESPDEPETETEAIDSEPESEDFLSEESAESESPDEPEAETEAIDSEPESEDFLSEESAESESPDEPETETEAIDSEPESEDSLESAKSESPDQPSAETEAIDSEPESEDFLSEESAESESPDSEPESEDSLESAKSESPDQPSAETEAIDSETKPEDSLESAESESPDEPEAETEAIDSEPESEDSLSEESAKSESPDQPSAETEAIDSETKPEDSMETEAIDSETKPEDSLESAESESPDEPEAETEEIDSEPEQPEATVNRQPQPTQTYSIPQQSPQYLETENDRKDKPVVNPSLTQTPRYQIADVIPLQYETSILDWLERSGRLMDRTSETDESLLDSEEEIAELIENDGKYDDDDDDDILVDDD